MRTIVNLFVTFLIVGSAAPIVFTATLAGMITLNENGNSTMASFLPAIVLVASIILVKLLYKGVDYLIRTVFW